MTIADRDRSSSKVSRDSRKDKDNGHKVSGRKDNKDNGRSRDVDPIVGRSADKIARSKIAGAIAASKIADSKIAIARAAAIVRVPRRRRPQRRQNRKALQIL